MINKFSKMNTRYKTIMQQLEEAKVCQIISTDYPVYVIENFLHQQQKEALDDLSTELELADEDELVL